MTDLRDRLRPLVDDAVSAVPPLAEIERRAHRLRMRRRTGGAAGAVAILAAILVVVPVGLASWRSVDVVLAPGPGQGPQRYDADGVRFTYPDGWMVVADPPGDYVVVGTHPLAEADAILAMLTRHDAAFSDSFPETGTFFAVGGDRLQSVYSGGTTTTRTVPQSEWEQWPAEEQPEHDGDVDFNHIDLEATIGPDDRLGEPLTLSARSGRRVIARYGHVSMSATNFAVYASGPDAVDAVGAADDIVASLELIQSRTPDEPIPPPPAGAPSYPDGEQRARADAGRGRLAAAVDVDDIHVTITVGSECTLVNVTAPTNDGPVAGACNVAPPQARTFSSVFVHELPYLPLPKPGPPRTQNRADLRRRPCRHRDRVSGRAHRRRPYPPRDAQQGLGTGGSTQPHYRNHRRR